MPPLIFSTREIQEGVPNFRAKPAAIASLWGARAVHQIGAPTQAGLAVVAEVWQPVEVRPEMRFDELERLNQQTLELLQRRGLLIGATGDVYGLIVDR